MRFGGDGEEAVEIQVPRLDPCRLRLSFFRDNLLLDTADAEFLLGDALEVFAHDCDRSEIVTQAGDVYAFARAPVPTARTVELPHGVAPVMTLGRIRRCGRIAWTPDGERLATTSVNGAIELWDVATGERLVEVARRRGAMRAVAFTRDGRLASAGQSALALWDVAEPKALGEDSSTMRYDVAVASGGSTLATADEDGRARVWTARDELTVIHELAGHAGLVTCVAFHPLTMVASGGDDRTIKLWDVPTGRRLATLEGHQSFVLDVEFDPTGEILYSASDDMTIRVWDARSGRQLAILEGHASGVKALSAARLLASCARDGSVRLWDPRSLTTVAEFNVGGGGWPAGLAFDPTGTRLACAVRQGTAVDVYELDVESLLRNGAPATVRYATAKVVLAGETGAGKTALAMRLGEDVFTPTVSTSWARFWPVDALARTRPDGTRCDVILWDLPGSLGYPLPSVEFDLAVLVFDASSQVPFEALERWIGALGIGPDRLPAILVAAGIDRGAGGVTSNEITRFCERLGLAAYVETSAGTDAGMELLRSEIRRAIDWDRVASVGTTETFKRIKDTVLARGHSAGPGETIATIEDVRRWIAGFEVADSELLGVTGRLAADGYVVELETADFSPRILLWPGLLDAVTGSLLVHAKANPDGSGALDEEFLRAGRYTLGELTASKARDAMLITDAAVDRVIETRIGYRDARGGEPLLVFPSAVHMLSDTTPLVDGLHFGVSGFVGSRYARAVVELGYASEFTRLSGGREWTRFSDADGALYEIRAGEPEIVTLAFQGDAAEPTGGLFAGLVRASLEPARVFSAEAAVCPRCGHVQDPISVHHTMERGRDSVSCPVCATRVEFPSPFVPRPDVLRRVSHEQVAIERRVRFERVLYRLSSFAARQGRPAPTCFATAQASALADDLVKAGLHLTRDRGAADHVLADDISGNFSGFVGLALKLHGISPSHPVADRLLRMLGSPGLHGTQTPAGASLTPSGARRPGSRIA